MDSENHLAPHLLTMAVGDVRSAGLGCSTPAGFEALNRARVSDPGLDLLPFVAAVAAAVAFAGKWSGMVMACCTTKGCYSCPRGR